MAKFILIRGQQNSGKTTTIGLVYNELLKISEKVHTFKDKEVEVNSLEFDKVTGETLDFTAIVKIGNKNIGLKSAGDVPKDLEKEINIFIKKGIDIIICCSRSRNVKGSSYRMIIDKFSKENIIIKEVWVSYSPNVDDKLIVKAKSVREIIELINDN